MNMSAPVSELSEDYSGSVDEDDPRWKDEREYCICHGRDNGEFMINCEGCEQWYHGRCVGIAESQGSHIDNYFCPQCTEEGKGHTTYKGLGKRGTETRDDDGSSAPKRQKLSYDEKKKFDMLRRKEEIEKLKAEKAEKRKSRDEQRRKERELNAAKLAAEEEAKKIELEAKKKKEEEDLKLRREKMAANIAAAIEEAFAKDQESKSIDKDLLENLKPIGPLSIEIEMELFAASNNSIDKNYLNQYRTLVYNLRDVKNSTLRFRILKGLLKPNVLVTMDSEQLANKDIAQYRQKRDQDLLVHAVRPKDTDKMYIKTDVGLEAVAPSNDEEENADLDFLDNALDTVLIKSREVAAKQKAEEEKQREIERQKELELAEANGESPLKVSGGLNRSNELNRSGEFNGENHGENEGQSPLKSSFGAPGTPQRPLMSSLGASSNSFPVPKPVQANVDMNDIGDIGDEDLQEPEFEPEDNNMDVDDGNKGGGVNLYGVSTPEYSDDQTVLPSTLPTWAGTVKYQFQGLDLIMPLSAFHIEGPEVGELLPRILKVEHRMDLRQLLDYLPKLDSSSSRSRTTMYFTVADQSSDEQHENYVRLFQHFKEINRAGVFILHSGDTTLVPHGYFKELYIFPLGATDPKPAFIDNSSNYDRDLQNTLVGVFITEKTKDGARPKPPKSSLSSSTPAPIPQPVPSAVTDDQAKARLDGIASLIAALNPANKPALAPQPVAAPILPPPVQNPLAANPLSSTPGLAALLANAQPLSNPLAALLGSVNAAKGPVAPVNPLPVPQFGTPSPLSSNPLAPNPFAALLGQTSKLPVADAPYDPMTAGQSTPSTQPPPSFGRNPQHMEPYGGQQYPPQQPPRVNSYREDYPQRGSDRRGGSFGGGYRDERGHRDHDDRRDHRDHRDDRRFDDRRGGFDDRRGDDRRGHFDDRRGDDRRGGFDDRRGDDRRGSFDDRRNYDDRDRGFNGGGYRGNDRGGYRGAPRGRGQW